MKLLMMGAALLGSFSLWVSGVAADENVVCLPRLLNTVELKAAFETVYELAVVYRSADQLPVDFCCCYERLQRGGYLQVSEFFQLLHVLFESLGALTRAARTEGALEVRDRCSCQAQLDALEYDLFEIIDDIQVRLALLERMHWVH